MNKILVGLSLLFLITGCSTVENSKNVLNEDEVNNSETIKITSEELEEHNKKMDEKLKYGEKYKKIIDPTKVEYEFSQPYESQYYENSLTYPVKITNNLEYPVLTINIKFKDEEGYDYEVSYWDELLMPGDIGRGELDVPNYDNGERREINSTSINFMFLIEEGKMLCDYDYRLGKITIMYPQW